MFTLLIATGNPGKIVELQDLLQDLPVKLVTPADVGLGGFDVIEDGHHLRRERRQKSARLLPGQRTARPGR